MIASTLIRKCAVPVLPLAQANVFLSFNAVACQCLRSMRLLRGHDEFFEMLLVVTCLLHRFWMRATAEVRMTDRR